MAITAKQVNELRKETGAGMMDCKKALVEAEGDFEKAIEILRKKGQKISAARAGREAKEGAVLAKVNEAGNEAVILELNCETDFVALNEDFLELGNAILDAANKEKPANLEALKELSIGGRKVADLLEDAMGKIGEKIDVRNYARVSGEKVITYIHPGARVGVLVAFKGVNGKDLEAVGKDIAMQIAAMSPVAIDKDGVDQATIEKELQIGRETALAEGKPEQIVDKIAQGKLNKFFKEKTLLNQEFVKDTSKTIAQYLKGIDTNLTVSAFERVERGSEDN